MRGGNGGVKGELSRQQLEREDGKWSGGVEEKSTWRGNEREDECLCSLWNQVIHTPAAAGAASRYTRGWKRMVIDMKFRSAATDMP